MKKSNLAPIVILVICAITAASLFAMQPSPASNTTNISNNANNSTVVSTNSSTANNTTVSRDNGPNGNNNHPPSSVSADEAKDLAKKYVGPDVILGKPAMTTYKGVHAWQVPVYTMNHKFINNIYIDERTGQKVN